MTLSRPDIRKNYRYSRKHLIHSPKTYTSLLRQKVTLLLWEIKARNEDNFQHDSCQKLGKKCILLTAVCQIMDSQHPLLINCGHQ